MSNLNYSKFEVLSLQKNPLYDEKWVQARIAEDPKILGLGDLTLLGRERKQPGAGRLDLLLCDEDDAERRYEVEIQLGQTDESHIIRTIEYWDIERKRFPQYEHCAVIVAENITSRFLNVISLFNGAIPLIAIKMQAVTVGSNVSLVFTTVLDEMIRGPEDDVALNVVTDRQYWEKKAGVKSLKLVDEFLKLLHKIDPKIGLTYLKHYVGLQVDNRPANFVSFQPKQKHINLSVKLDRSEEIDEKIRKSGLEMLSYDKGFRLYRMQVESEDIDSKADFLIELAKKAYDKRFSE